MRNRTLIVTGVYVLLLAQIWGSDLQRVQFYYNIAEGNYLIGDRGGAERGIEQSLRLDPDHAPSLALRARILLDQSNAARALEAAEEAVAAEPEKLEYQVLKALILGNLNRRADALAQVEGILKAAPANSEDARAAQQIKGLLKMADQNWDEAATAFRQTYDSHPESSATGRQLASEAYLEKARSAPDLQEALAAIDQAIALYEGATGVENLKARERLTLTRARMLARAGRIQEAIQALQKIVGQNPENLEAAITLASIYADQENWSALEDLIEPIARNPQLADIALYMEGRVALSRDRIGTARAKFEEALELNRKQPTSLQHTLEFYRSICLERLKRHEESDKSLRAAIEGGYIPESSSETNHLGRLLSRMGDIDTLIPILEKALLRNEANPDGWAMLGRAHIKKEQTTLAISALNQSLLQNPNQAETLALRGSLLRKIGDLEGAMVDYERAHALLPSSPVLSYECGLVLLQLGRIKEAESFLQNAARRLSTHVTLDLLHASCAYVVGNYEESTRSLEEYLNPELADEALMHFKDNRSETAYYLKTLLKRQAGTTTPEMMPPNQAARLFMEYEAGRASLKQLLDEAGRANTSEQARRQICSVTFWLAELELSGGDATEAIKLLEISIESGASQQPEFQFANWKLGQLQAQPVN